MPIEGWPRGCWVQDDCSCSFIHFDIVAILVSTLLAGLIGFALWKLAWFSKFSKRVKLAIILTAWLIFISISPTLILQNGYQPGPVMLVVITIQDEVRSIAKSWCSNGVPDELIVSYSDVWNWMCDGLRSTPTHWWDRYHIW